MKSGNDVDLLYKVSKGDANGFAMLFNTYKNITYSFAVKICQSAVLAEEIVQDVFMNIWTNRECLAEVENFGAYLRVITRNKTLQVLRQIAAENRRHAISTINWQEEHNDTEGAIFYNESREILNKALEALPPQQKLIYQMCHLQGMKQQEVADQLHISPLTVKAHLRQAVRRVREYFIIEAALFMLVFLNFFL